MLVLSCRSAVFCKNLGQFAVLCHCSRSWFNLLSVNLKYVLVSLNKTATFSLYSSLSITTMDLSLSAGRIFTVSSFLRFCSAFSCSFVILTVAGTLQFLRMFATETRIVSFADWLILKMRFSTEDKIFATGIFFGVMEKLRPFSRAVISTGPNVRCDTLTTNFSLSTTGGLCFLLFVS